MVDAAPNPAVSSASLAGAGEAPPPRLLLWGLLLAAGVCHVGFSYQAWGWPAIDGYPIIERFLDPGYLTRDFYTNTAGAYNVDTTQAWLFGGLERLSGIPFEVSIAWANLLRCLAFPALVYGFFLALSGQWRVAMWATVLGTLSDFALPKTVGWPWVWGDPSTAMFAIVAVIAGWTLALERRLFWSLFAFALAALVHPLTALHGLLVWGLIALLDFSRDEQLAALRSPALWAGGALFAVSFLSQYWLLSLGAGEKLPLEQYVEIIARERHPGDYLPSHFTRATTLSFVLAMAAVLTLTLRLRRIIPRFRLVAGVLGSYGLVCVLGGVFVELFPVRFFVQLIPYRMANVGAPFCLFVLGVFCVEQLRTRRFVSAGLLVAGFALTSPLTVSRLLWRLGLTQDDANIGGAVLVLLSVLTSLWDEAALSDRLKARLSRALDQRVWVTALLLLGLLGAGLLRGRERAEFFSIPNLENQHPIYAWMRAHTEPQAVFFLDQFSSDRGFRAAITPQLVRLLGRRAVAASLDFPFLDKDMREWFARWQTLLQGRSVDRVEHADAATLKALRARFPFDYVVRRHPLAPAPDLPLITSFQPAHGVERLYVYRVGSGAGEGAASTAPRAHAQSSPVPETQLP